VFANRTRDAAAADTPKLDADNDDTPTGEEATDTDDTDDDDDDDLLVTSIDSARDCDDARRSVFDADRSANI
jgi:hypothetical protein